MELVDLADLRDAEVGLHPIGVLDVGVQLRDCLLVHRVGGWQFGVTVVGQFDGSLGDVHCNSNFGSITDILNLNQPAIYTPPPH